MTCETITDTQLIREAVFGDGDGLTVVAEIKGDHGRWALGIDTVLKRESDGKLFIVNWRKGVTEYQEHEFNEPAYECEAIPVTVFKYRIKTCPSSPLKAPSKLGCAPNASTPRV